MADLTNTEYEDKISYFQAITGLDDPDLCTEILSAHGWDLELAISTFTSSAMSNHPTPLPPPPPPPPSLPWRLITLPFSIATSAFNLTFWIAGGVLSRSLNLLGLFSPDPTTTTTSSSSESSSFVSSFVSSFPSPSRPDFSPEGFMDTLQRSQREFKLMFVYLHSPDHPDVPEFCQRCLCSEAVSGFVNEHFVSWGGSIRGAEGFKMSNSLKASRYPFCAVVMASTNQRIVLLSQVVSIVNRN